MIDLNNIFFKDDGMWFLIIVIFVIKIIINGLIVMVLFNFKSIFLYWFEVKIIYLGWYFIKKLLIVK